MWIPYHDSNSDCRVITNKKNDNVCFNCKQWMKDILSNTSKYPSDYIDFALRVNKILIEEKN